MSILLVFILFYTRIVNLVAYESSVIQVDVVAKLLVTMFSSDGERSAAEARSSAGASAGSSADSTWRELLWRWLSTDVQKDAHLQTFLSRLPDLLGGGIESLFADRPLSLGDLVASARSLIDAQAALQQDALAAESALRPAPSTPLQPQRVENIVAEPDSTSPNVDLLE